MVAALAACAPQIEPEPPQADPKADAKDAGGVDAEFAVKAFALGEPTLAASSPKNETTFPVLKGGGVNIDVAYTVSNFALGQVRCYLDGTFVGQGSGTSYKYVGVKKGAHTLACVLADNTGTELTAPTARFAIVAKVAEPCTLGTDCTDDNACSDEACVDLQCVYGIKLACCQSKYNCAAGETCVNANTANAKCSACTVNADCNDNESCTTDTCDLTGPKGVCKNTMADPECCSKADAPCDDGKSCTVDSCNTTTGKCKHVQPPNVCCKDSDCSTADPCLVSACVDNECRNGPDLFKPDCCSAGYNTTCDDKNYCTVDKCEKNMGGWTQCTHVKDATKPKCCDINGTNAQCDDKQPCTNDFCDNYECKNLQVKTCCQQTLDCDDTNPCTLDACEIPEGASAGLCTYKKIAGCCTTIADCDDNKFCTLDTCNYAALTCKYTKTDPTCCDVDAECDDGKLCTINACVNKVCVYSKDLTKPLCCESNAECSDGNPCTFDTCDLGAGALPVTSGLAAHYDARDATSVVKDGTGKVTEWKDISGKARHLTPNGVAPMYGDKLINGLPAIDFDGVDRRMATAGFPLTTEVTVFAVIQWRKSDGWGAIAHHGSRDMDWSLEQNAIKQPGTTHFQSGNDNNGAELTLLENTNYILFGRVAGTKRTYAAVGGGSSYVEATADGNTIGQGTKVLFVGSSEISEDSHAYVGQLLYYDKPLSDDDKNAVLNYLRKSWGIDATLAATSNTCKFQSNGQAGCCASNEECADNDCTTQDFCDGFNQCKHTLATGKCKIDIDCDDGKPCTQDKCITVDGCGQCQNVAQPAALCCDNDAYCDDKNPCTLDKCGSDNKCTTSKVNDCCLDDTDAQTACNDNNACTIEYCLNNQCRHTVPKNGCCASDADCNDSNGCTTDKCSNIVAGKGACSYVTTPGCNACSPDVASSYDDGNVCTADGCVLAGGVYKQTHTAISGCCLDKLDCNDSKPCTYDYCIFNECVHTSSEAGQALCCDPATEAVDCAYLNTSCAVGKCQSQTDGALKCTAVEKTPCVVNLSYCQDFEGTGTVKSMGWLPGDVAGTASSNWGIAKDGPLGPDQYARLTWTPTKSNFLTCLQSPVVQAAGASAITMQFDRSFLPSIANTTLTVRGSLGGASVDWNTATILDGPLATMDQLGPEKLTIKLPPELSGSNGLRIAFCVAASSSLNFEEFAVDNVCIVKGGPPVTKNGCPANQSAAVGTVLVVPMKVVDPDPTDTVSFELVSGPSFVTVKSALYYWIDETWNSNVVVAPTQLSDVGEHTITVRYTDGFLQGLCTFKITVTYQGGYLIWRPSEVTAASANAIKAALTSKGQFGQIISDLSLYPDLAKFNGVFITLGVYPDNHVLLESEVKSLKTYLSGGGKVYMEGGDTFMFDTPTTLHAFFKIKGVLDSAPNGVTGPLKGFAAFADTSTSPPTPKAWAFDQSTAYNNVNDQIDGNLSVQKTRNLLKNDAIEKFWVAVGHDNPTTKYRTIGMSVPFGGVVASGSDTQTVMMERIITFFNNGFADCKADADCDDGNACTADKCTTGACTNDNTCLCAAQTTLDCGAAPTKLVNNGGDSTQATSVYSCDLANQWLGKEVSYGFKSTQGKPVTVELKNVSNPSKTRLFVLKATGKGCDPLGCIANNANSITFAAGANIQYYIVVDTAGPADTTQFDLSITCGQGEDCTNGKDDNANTLIDCLDKNSCCGDPACQVEICNGIDDNCSGTIDEGCDDDGDAWCDSSLTVVGKPPICVNGTGDCNDTDGTVNPGLAEICNNKKDDNCNTLQDEENATGCTNLWTDLDGDAFGAGTSKCLCAASGTYKATKGGDCNDAKQTINPGMQESCSTPEDDNCDGSNNDTNALGCSNFYTDIDGDAYGTTPFKCMCVGSGLVSAKQPGDCNDANAGVNPAIAEKCNAVDDNCNGQVDEGCDDDGDDYCDTGLAYDPPAAGQDVCSTAKDGQTLTLACAAGSTITAVKYAEYGTVTGTCPTFTKGSCDAANEINYIASNCIGKSSCSTINWHTVLGDPCGGVVKTMAVVVTCSSGTGTASLDVCPKGPGDTDDLDPAINPEGKEICDGKDNNSDGVIDEDCDKDKDGYCDSGIFTVGKPKACPLGGGDCNDGNVNINPGVQEDCKTAEDDNCNGGNNDAGAVDCTPLFFDADGDKFGTNANKCYCQAVGQYSAQNPGDCNDDNKLINPNASEICDNADNDCDKQVDNGCDDDGDLFCDTAMTVVGSPTVCANGNGDCVDTDAAINPGKAEVCNNGKDDNCNGSENDVNAIGCTQFYADADGDTYGAGTKKCMCTTSGTFTSTNGADCDDTIKTINPGAPEACNNKDDNCDGAIDEGCDDDKDGYCDASMGYGGSATICPNGGGDCDDTKASVYKGKAGEICDGLDDDCDGKADNGCDDDGDGWCDAALTVSNPLPSTCSKGSGDCDDYDSSVNPGSKEVCSNLKDDNCNGSQNDPNAIGCLNFYFDADSDNYGLNISQCLCQASGAYKAKLSGDCDDTTGAVAPGQAEKCDTLDNNCNGDIDEDGATGCTNYFYDNDKDGYGLDLVACKCAAASPYTASQKGDCDDTNPNMVPGKTEVCDNIDNNCDTKVDEGCNADGDQFCTKAMTVSGTPNVCPLGGGDCDDTDKNVSPAGNEICDGKDNNCSGVSDEGCDDDADGYCDANMNASSSSTVSAVNDQFESGAPGWSSSTTTPCGSLGSILGGYNVFGAGAKVSKSINLGSHTQLTVKFDFIKIDSWDGESGQLRIDGNLVWSQSYSAGTGSQLCGSGNGGWNEQADKITITIPHTANTALIEFTSTLDQGANDESWGLDNVVVTYASSYPAICPKGTGDCADNDNTINPGLKEVCGNTIDENCSGSTNDPNAVNCQLFFADFDGDGYGKGSTVFKKVAINEIRRNTNGFPGATGNEFIEILVTADITVSELGGYFFGDSSTTGDAKLGKYQLELSSLNLTTLKAGTIITVAGQGAGVAQDLTYNPAGADWNLTVLFDTSYVTVTAAGGDFAASDVAWIDSSSAGTTSIDSIRYGAATGALGAAAKTQLGGAPSNGTPGTIAFTGDITGLNNAANYALDGTATPGQPNGGSNSTFVTWLRQVSSTGESQCLCIANSTYKTTQGGDCNDGNSNVFTGATEVCDGIDNNCNSVIDEGCDQDGDGYCDSSKITIGTPSTCPNGGGDCKDTDKTVNPGAIESCADGQDTNCDGNLNGTGGAGCVDFYYDGDSDGFGANVKLCMCAANGPYKAVAAGDCDDTNAAVKPGVPENCSTAYDDNCNGSLNDAGATNCTNFYKDVDKDGYGIGTAVCACIPSGDNIATVGGDCNDGDGQTNPGKLELCDGKDNNCNGAAPSAVENNLATGTSNSLTNYLAQEVVWTLPGAFSKIDVSFNAPTAQNVTLTIFKSASLPAAINTPTPLETIGPVSVAQNGAGIYTKYTFTSTLKPNVVAGEKWVFVWKASSTGLTIQESTGNQYPKGAAHFAPSSPFSWTALGSGSTDVTFQAFLVVSGATVDEGCDDDGDKYCDSAMETASPAPAVCINGGNDCDDTKSTVNPGAAESCDNLDNNCNAASDEGCDADGDQWCAASKTVVGSPTICPLGKDDCDDGNKNIFPGKAENCDDLDNNCNASTDEGCNADNDGYCTSAMATIGTPAICIKGGGDCKDADAAINPGALEACDGIDNNCAGGIDEVCADLDKDGYCNGSVGCATCGNGIDGDFNATTNQTLTAKGYNFKNFTIAAGVVVTVVGNVEPLLIRATNKIDIKGTLVLDGTAGSDATDSSNGCLGGQSSPGKAVAAGYDGGYGIYNNGSSGAYPGNGPGPGKEGIYNFSGGCGSGGGGGGHATAGANGVAANGSQGMGGGTYASIDQDKLIGGSGGGAGGYGSAYNATGAGGGGGGGVVRLDAPDVIISGKVTANGGAGGWQKNDCDGGASGGGAGGAIWVRGNKVDVTGGTLSAVGGAAGQINSGINCGTSGGAGGNGRIRIDANTLVSSGTTSPNYSTGAKDGLGSPLSASCPKGGGDCNDSDKNVNPAVAEDCNTATDDNCNGIVNEANAANCTNWYADEDLDGYGGGTGTCQCTQSKALPTNIGGDCKDTDISVNPGQAEVCDNLDNDCKSGTDNGCDDDGDLYCDNTMILKDTAKCTKSLTSCKDQAIWPPQYKGSPITMDTRSHGGGFNPFYKEYWYPEWAGGTVYRYDLNFQSKGTFNAGQGEIMQLWGDTDGDYYTANWGYYTVTKRKALSSQILWTYNIGYYAGGVTADANYVYAMRADYSYTVHQLNKSTGQLIKTFNLNGGSFGDWMYGGLAKVGDTFLVGRGNAVVWAYDANTLNNTGSYNVATNIYNMAFNGTDYLISANNSTVYSYKVWGNVCGQSCSSSILWPPKTSTVVNFNTVSHGGGYSPKAKEFWYPSWSGSTVYRYNSSNYAFIGTFDSGQQQMMQLWGDTDGYYYTANWGLNTITKKVDLSSTTAWTYNMGESAGAVTADSDYVYALGADSMRVRRLNKATGALIDTFLLSGGGSETIYGGMAVGGPNLLVGRGSGAVYHYSLNQMTTGDIWPPVYTGAVNMNTRSHGGGYSPKDKEFWYPEWAGSTVYRYNEQYQLLGTFDSGQPQMMQLWGDTDGTYYTANWGYGTVTKMANKSGTRLWTTNLGQTMAGVTADENYVYAVPSSGSTVWRLNKSNGSVVATYNFIGGNTGNTCYGGLAVVGDKLLVGRDNAVVYRYNKNTYQYLDSFNVATNIYNMAYTGSEYCISNNGSTVWCYALYGKSVPLVSTFSTATNIYNMSFTGDKYCISNNSSTVYCYNVAGSNCTKGDDCDDTKSTTYPNATEICDNADSNCNNIVDDGCDDDNDNYCEAGLTIIGTPSTCTGGGGDCNDNTPSINPAPTTKENCATPEDDNCDGASDQLSAIGCSKWYFDNDGDGQGTTAFECRCAVSGKYTALQSGDCDDNDPKQFSGTGVPKAIAGVYKGAPITMETRSHGGGYSPTYNEYWYPEWAGYTIYRYDQQYNYKGTFNSGLPQMMQLWGDNDDTYYTANWGYNTINKWKGMGGTQVWSFNIGSTAGAVTADGNNVYAMRSSGMDVWVLDKATGGQVKIINLSGGSDGGNYGGLAVYAGVLYVGRDNAQVYRYDLSTGKFIDQFAAATNIYNMAFNGTEYCISNNSNQVHCYTIAGNTAPVEICDGKDNNCNLVIDEGCDADKDGYCDAKLQVTSNAGCPKTTPVVTTCLNMPPTYKGAPVTMETYSHGGGYSPKYNEYWYPGWAGPTIYRYSATYQYLGAFNSGRGEIMQLWGDTDGTYYTANWGYASVSKWSDKGATELWKYNMPTTAGAVTADATFVYAMVYYGMEVHVINKVNGAFVKKFNLNGGVDTTMYGGLAVVGGSLFLGRYNGAVYRYDLQTGQIKDQFSVATNIYNMAFNGKEYCISANNNQVYCYNLNPTACSFGDDCSDLEKGVNPGIKELCDGLDNNCNSQQDEGCDDDLDGWCDSGMTVVGTPDPGPGKYNGSPVTMETYSHGGGFSPKYNEYWYPNWGSSTVYRYDKNRVFLGTFDTGHPYSMQLWGDTDGTYYIANWHYYTVQKKADKSSSTIWSTNLGNYVSAVTADDKYVYAMPESGMTMWVLDKNTGGLIKQQTLNGGVNTTQYGGLAVVGNFFYLGRYDGNVYRYDKATLQLKDQFNIPTNIYNMAFNGKEYCVSPNSSQVFCANLFTSGCVYGGGDCDDTNVKVNPATQEVCDGADNNCNKVVDEAGSTGCSNYYYDGDQDGYGVNSSQCLCESGKQFKAVATPTTYANARADCKAWGGDLVSIYSDGDNSYVRKLANDAGVTGNVWIGLSDSAQEGLFKWVSNETMTFSNWDNNEPAGAAFVGTAVLTPTQQAQLNTWYGDSAQKWSLCYRGTQHGFNSTTFHNQCNAYSKTLSILRDTSGNIFGGYNSGTWAGGGSYYNPGGTWLFSFKNNFKSNWGGNCAGQNYGTYNHPSYGPTFGGGHDLYVDSSMKSGYTYFGYSYFCPVGSCGNGNCMNYFSYQYSGWQLNEVEVFYANGTATGGPDNPEDFVYMKSTGKWADDAGTATAGYVCSRSLSLFTAKNNTDCDDACPTCAPGLNEQCEGKDNNCNSSVDEGCDDDNDDYCDAGMVTIGTAPTCSKGGLDCDDNDASMSPGAKELCNTKDDNCNAITDEQAADGCPLDKNAVFKCQAGQCIIQSCATGFYDLNAAFSDGCECNGNDQFEPNDLCSQAYLLDSSLNDGGKQVFSPEGKVVTTDQDWYRVYAADLGDGGYAVCDKFNLRVTFAKQPGGLGLDVYRGGCPAGSLPGPPGPEGKPPLNSDQDKRYESVAGNQTCCGQPSFNWFTNFKGASGGEPSRQWSEYGECPCSTGDTFDQSNNGWWNGGNPYCMQFNTNGVCFPRGYYMTTCKDDSAWFYIKVYRPSGAPTCGNYKLEITNGVYGQPGTGNGRKGW